MKPGNGSLRKDGASLTPAPARPFAPDSHGRSPAIQTLAGRTLAAGRLRLAGQALRLIILVGLSVAMARLLTPADVGLFALAGVAAAFAATFRDFGLGHATLYQRELTPAQLGGLLRLQAGLALGLAVLLAAAAPLLAWCFGEPDLLGIAIVMAAVTGVASMGVLPEAMLARTLRFGVLAGIEVGALFASAVAGIGLALLGAGPWALVGQAATDSLLKSTLLWLLMGRQSLGLQRDFSCKGVIFGSRRPPHPPPKGSSDSTRNLAAILRYSRETMAARALNYLAQNADLAVVGLIAGTAGAGLYSRAYQWASLPMLHIYGALLSVMVAGLSRARDDEALFRACAHRLMLPIFTLCMPALAFMALAAEALVLLLLGAQWHEATPLLRLFCIGAFAGCVLQMMKPIYLATGCTARKLRWSLIATPVMLAAILAGAGQGVTGVAGAFVLAGCILVVPGVLFALHGSPLRPRDLAGIVWRPATASLGAAALLAIVAPLLPPASAAPLLHLLIAGLLYGAAYSILWLGLPGGRAALDELLEHHQYRSSTITSA